RALVSSPHWCAPTVSSSSAAAPAAVIYTLSLHDALPICSPVAVQRALRDEGSTLGYHPDVWNGMLELGWGAVAFSEQDGGLDFGFDGYAPLFEDIGRHLSASPLLSSVVLCCRLIVQLGTEAQRQHWLPALISGERRLALALEEGARHQPDDFAVTARRDGSNWVLNGSKSWVTDAVGADGWLVVASEADGGCSVFLVSADQPGVQLS